MIDPKYRAQVDLLLQILPYVAKEPDFALKGGTAINLFVRDMPRLSVDIDLTYLPFDKRDTALQNIAEILERVKASLKTIPGIAIMMDEAKTKLTCKLGSAQVVIEVNPIMRGHIHPVRLMQVSNQAQEEFKKFAAINVVSHGELFGGKICAALDRQHPRDLFDIYHLFQNEGLSDDIKLGFITCLLSHGRPINEVIKPNIINQRTTFETQFDKMTKLPFTYEDHETTLQKLIQKIHAVLTKEDKDFLLGFKQGHPDWSLIPIPSLQDMPAIKWKLQNIQKLIRENPEKHKEQLEALKNKLG